MRVLVAPDKFKGCLSSAEVAAAIARGLRSGWPMVEVDTCPLADGGEGTMEVLVEATGGRTVPCRVTGPLGEETEALLGFLGDGKTAVVEMAQASGLVLVPPGRRNPLVTTTRGTGELIKEALDRGARRIIVGIGGSATNDGGVGMASALGARFLDAEGREIRDGGGALEALHSIDLSSLDPRVRETEIVVASDVVNPLLGEEGAARVYGPQKGAGKKEVEVLEKGLARLAEVAGGTLGERYEDRKGAGAAGGLGFGLMAFLGAEMRPGIEVVMEAVRFEERLTGCGMVVTGEGRLDGQTGYGKTVSGVAAEASRRGIPVVALGGEVKREARALRDIGVTAVFSVSPGPVTLEESLERAEELLEEFSLQLGRLLFRLLA